MILEFERGMSDAKRWFRKSGLSVRNRLGKNVATAKPQPANPRTENQTAARDSMKGAAEAWRAMPEAARLMWNDYARRFGNLIGEQLQKDLSGWDVFLPAWRNRTLLEEAAPVEPLPGAPPPAVVTVEEIFTGVETDYSFRITHNVPPDGHVLLVRVTPPTATRARRPYARTARMILGHDRRSTAPLPANGGVVTFIGTSFVVKPGERFGVAMRIVRVTDGVHSRELFADLYRNGEDGPDGETAVPSADVAGPTELLQPGQISFHVPSEGVDRQLLSPLELNREDNHPAIAPVTSPPPADGTPFPRSENSPTEKRTRASAGGTHRKEVTSGGVRQRSQGPARPEPTARLPGSTPDP